MLFWNSSVEEPQVIGLLMDTSWCFERLSQGPLWIILAKKLLGKAANDLSWKSFRCVNSSNISHQEDHARLQSVPKGFLQTNFRLETTQCFQREKTEYYLKVFSKLQWWSHKKQVKTTEIITVPDQSRTFWKNNATSLL